MKKKSFQKSTKTPYTKTEMKILRRLMHDAALGDPGEENEAEALAAFKSENGYGRKLSIPVNDYHDADAPCLMCACTNHRHEKWCVMAAKS
jgi:hypothetical protein